ncbi:copper homeostasis membrane protein CopD (plasmid) [Rhizobium sp. WSM1274]|uniref:copper homeostasis membrane protein CopD n=1 Tax=Rhizobium sp. WSM1274 TaxID=3138254 RepID=UPI0021A7B25D|nr:copper homeostasis membrane protein CopD [Rhizobium leguminosarum]UWU31791.1 copper homeostasis membrane protein CopD [Rhizobium leguminosarum bv. viciae]
MITPQTALVLCRFLLFGAAMLLWGTFAYLSALVPTDLARRIGGRLQIYAFFGIAVVVATTAVLLPLRAAVVGEGWSDAIDPLTIVAVLFDTNVGWVWQLQAAAAALLGLSGLLSAHRRQAAVAVSSGLLLASQAFTGHAAMNQGWIGFAHQLNDIVHLLSGGAWLGALLPVLLLLPLLSDLKLAPEARTALIRFSNAGHAAVAIVLLTGIANMMLILGSLPLDWSFPYQVMLSIKIVLVIVMVTLAIANRYLFVPRLSRGMPWAREAIVRATLAEVVLGLVVLALVAWFGTLAPT